MQWRLIKAILLPEKLVRQSLLDGLFIILLRGGKSGLHRVECQVTPGGREPTESATESRPPKQLAAGKAERVR